MAIADVLLRGLAQFLVTRASAELQTTVIEQLRARVCPDVEAACSLDNALRDFKNDLPDSCNDACDNVSDATLGACVEARRSALCVGNGECPNALGCASLLQSAPACVACLRQSPHVNGTACVGAALTASVAANTCRVIGRDFTLSPSFGSAFQAAVAQDIAALPTGLIAFLEAPFGRPLSEGPQSLLAQAFVVHAVHAAIENSSPANVGHALRSFVRGWQCVTPSSDTGCATLKTRLDCALTVFTAAAETMPNGAEAQVPEHLVVAVIDAAAKAPECSSSISIGDDTRRRVEQIAPLARAIANVTDDLRRMQRSQSATPSTASVSVTTSSTDNAAPPQPSPSNASQSSTASVQALARDLVEAVNITLRIVSDSPNCPLFQIPDGFPAFVGAVAANDIPSALSRGMRFASAVFEQVPLRTPTARSAPPAPTAQGENDAQCGQVTRSRGSFPIPDTLVRVLSFGADLLAARAPDDAAAALDAFSAPVGSWRGKGTRRMFSITGMVGAGGGGEYTFARNSVASSLDGVGTLTGMVGADLTVPIRNNCTVTYLGGFLSLLDVGALLAQPTGTPTANGAATQSTLNPLQFVAPGLFFHFNIFKSPLNLMFGAQFLPVARTLQYTDSAGNTQSVDVSAVRFMGALTVDVTILPF